MTTARGRARSRAAVEFGLAGAAALSCAASWKRVCSAVLVAPIADGEPVTTSLTYHPHQVALAMLLAAVAGVLGVIGSARLCRTMRGR